jgi:hypothetical protein
LKMIEENQCRIHTLEWVLGQHDRYDWITKTKLIK